MQGHCRPGLARSACTSTTQKRRPPVRGARKSPSIVLSRRRRARSPPSSLRRPPSLPDPQRRPRPQHPAEATRRRSGCRRTTPEVRGLRLRRRNCRRSRRRVDTAAHRKCPSTSAVTSARCRTSTFSWKLSTGDVQLSLSVVQDERVSERVSS